MTVIDTFSPSDVYFLLRSKVFLTSIWDLTNFYPKSEDCLQKMNISIDIEQTIYILAHKTDLDAMPRLV